MFTNKTFKTAGQQTHNMSWTDEQLKTQLAVLPLVISYLEGRKDSNIIVKQLRLEFNKFNDFQTTRKFHP